MEQPTLFTIAVFTENHIGLLNQLSIILTRRAINIESITASRCLIPEVHKITLTCYSDPVTIEKVVKQIEKKIDVLKAFFYTDDQIVYQEVALYKVPTSRLLDEQNLEEIIRRHSARILEITRDDTVVEKTGHIDETEALFEELKRYDLRQFVRSGRVAITKSPIEYVDRFLAEQEQRRQNLDRQ